MKQWIITAGGDSVLVDGKLVPFAISKAPLFCLTEADKLFVAQQYASGHAEDTEYALLSRMLLVGIAVECPMDTRIDPLFRHKGFESDLVIPPDEPQPPADKPDAPDPEPWPTAVVIPVPARPVRRNVRGWRHVGSPTPPSPLEPGKKLEDEDDPTIFLSLSDAGELLAVFHRESYPMWKRLMNWITKAPVELGINPRTVVGLKEWESQRAWCQTVEGVFKGHQFSDDPTRGAKCNRCGRQLSWDELLNQQVCPACGMDLA